MNDQTVPQKPPRQSQRQRPASVEELISALEWFKGGNDPEVRRIRADVSTIRRRAMRELFERCTEFDNERGS